MSFRQARVFPWLVEFLEELRRSSVRIKLFHCNGSQPLSNPCGQGKARELRNLEAINAIDATPCIPFKSNASGTSGGLWEKFFLYFKLNQEEFLGRYDQRSNVETTFSMVKAKFGDGPRSKTDVAMKNEVLCKLICHNICCLISTIYELELKPKLWSAAS